VLRLLSGWRGYASSQLAADSVKNLQEISQKIEKIGGFLDKL
jgi:hypothetical protein